MYTWVLCDLARIVYLGPVCQAVGIAGGQSRAVEGHGWPRLSSALPAGWGGPARWGDSLQSAEGLWRQRPGRSLENPAAFLFKVFPEKGFNNPVRVTQCANS